MSRILVVDDEQRMRSSFSKMLTTSGHEVIAADPKVMREAADTLRDRLGTGVVVLAGEREGKANVLVAARTPVVPGAVVRARPIGVLLMEDEAGLDEKLLTVPADDLHPYYANVSSYRDLPKILVDQITHFFQHYKDLETNKWVKIVRWGEADEACRIIERAIEANDPG